LNNLQETIIISGSGGGGGGDVLGASSSVNDSVAFFDWKQLAKCWNQILLWNQPGFLIAMTLKLAKHFLWMDNLIK
jgi:hypothetical protein